MEWVSFLSKGMNDSMAIRLVALDLDNTLLDAPNHISEAGQAVIEKAIRQGVMVTLASGRMFSAVAPLGDQLGLDIPLITYNGALIKASKSGEVYFHLPVPYDLSLEIIRYAEENDLTVNTYIDEVVYVNRMSDEAEMYSSRYGAKVVAVPDLAAFLRQRSAEGSTKLLILAPEEIARKHLGILKQRFGDRLNIMISLPTYVEVVNKGVSKGRALLKLAERFGIHAGEIMAIGDSENDIEMLKAASIGVAVANAEESVKQMADYVTEAPDGNGVAEAFGKFIFEPASADT